jgi:hypothetical protein
VYGFGHAPVLGCSFGVVGATGVASPSGGTTTVGNALVGVGKRVGSTTLGVSAALGGGGIGVSATCSVGVATTGSTPGVLKGMSVGVGMFGRDWVQAAAPKRSRASAESSRLRVHINFIGHSPSHAGARDLR